MSDQMNVEVWAPIGIFLTIVVFVLAVCELVYLVDRFKYFLKKMRHDIDDNYRHFSNKHCYISNDLRDHEQDIKKLLKCFEKELHEEAISGTIKKKQ